jgi:hypothetical protein
MLGKPRDGLGIIALNRNETGYYARRRAPIVPRSGSRDGLKLGKVGRGRVKAALDGGLLLDGLRGKTG